MAAVKIAFVVPLALSLLLGLVYVFYQSYVATDVEKQPPPIKEIPTRDTESNKELALKSEERTTPVTEQQTPPVTVTTSPTVPPTTSIPRSGIVYEKCDNIWQPLGQTDPKYTEKVKYKIAGFDYCPFINGNNRWNDDKKVVVRSVYLDKREWNGHPSSYVFMVEIDRQVLSRDPFVKCQIGDQTSTVIDYMIPQLALDIRGWCNHLTHETIVVHCYLPPQSVAGKAVLFYKVDQQSPVVAAEPEKPLVIPGPRVPRPSPDKPTIVSCIAVQYGQPPFLAEWVRYQKTIGVSHIQMIAEPSIQDSGALKDPSVKKAIDEGFLAVDIWHKWFSPAQIYDHSQLLAYEDCLYRFQGLYDYLFPHDADDFLVPLISDQRQLPYYANKHCSDAGTCELVWYQMCPTCGVIRETGEDGNVTDTLAHFDRCKRATKGVHNIPVTFDVSTHTGHKWAPGYKKIEVPPNDIYVAHNRLF